MLATSQLTKQFGGLTAVDDVSIFVEDEIVGLMGPNGSGKSTFINLLTGIHKPTAGSITYGGSDITGRETYEIARMGMARTFQTPHVFDDLTVLENTMVPLLRTKTSRSVVEERARECIDLVDLSHVITHKSRQLSGGQKKLLEFARNLMVEPDILLMDEPFAGVHPDLREIMYERIHAQRERGTSFLIVSHDVDTLYNLTDRILVFEQGQLIADAPPEEVRNDDRVVQAYLGGAGG